MSDREGGIVVGSQWMFYFVYIQGLGWMVGLKITVG